VRTTTSQSHCETARRAPSRRRSSVVLGLVLATSAAGLAPALAGDTVSVTRLEGPNRYATAAEVATATFPAGAKGAILASGERSPDALGAAFLAGTVDAPVLLTHADAVPAVTLAALAELEVTDIAVIGGSAVVSDEIVAQLSGLGYAVGRVGGLDRYETSRAIATAGSLVQEVGSLGDGGPTAMVTSGEGFADALAGAPLSYAEGFPLLLTPGKVLSEEPAAALEQLGIEQVLLLGGPGAVSAEVEAQIVALGITVRRLSGVDRTATATALADLAIDELGWPATHVTLARGDGFADALAGGPHGGAERSPVLLTTSPTALGDVTRDWLRARAATVTSIDVLGGTAAVSDATVTAAREAATTAG
jgi:putative cell wall-binding protein